MAKNFFTPIETFDIFNSENEDLPAVETWKVYPYIALGCLEDVFVNYFNHADKTKKTLESAVQDS